MSKHKKHSNKKNHLKFEEAKQMTIEEAVRKDNELKAGITESDGVLDRYIKQHRDEIGSKKFETQSLQLDTKALDDFIKKQRESVDDLILLDDEETVKETAKIDVFEAKPVETASLFEEKEESILLEQSEPMEKTSSKKRGLLIASLIAFLLVLFSGGYWLTQQNSTNNDKTSISTTETKSNKKDSKKENDSQAKKDFDDKYGSFFVDEGKTQLKNDQFDKLPELEMALKALEGSSDYDMAKEQFDRLAKQIDAVNKINAQFTSAIIVDGAKVDATVVDAADFDSLGTEVLNTGNATLDNIIQSSISDGRQQLAKKAEEASAAQAAQEQATAQAANVAPTATATVPVDNNVSSGGYVAAPSAAMQYGITNYDPAILQRHLSRVPYNHDVIADVNNPAWVFNEGVLERILETSRARGYISGNDFILERVNIINGNGYYNLFKPDGTYLFSINAKTGYFVGNGKGYADSLDY